MPSQIGQLFPQHVVQKLLKQHSCRLDGLGNYSSKVHYPGKGL